MDVLDLRILLNRGMGVRAAAAYDGCNQRAAHAAMARIMYEDGYRSKIGRGHRNVSAAGGHDGLCLQYDMDRRLWWSAWKDHMFWVNTRKEAERNAREAAR